ncbi:MAG: flavodoxin-dependent (E)-4-hydroxy-3-methylbut-2-enyl-diphosphate synthase [Thermodesulfobacteriota bacterium]|jgi:(E)-4-hydroxy-3-methylbut-2-enyl-diphosphate synthase|nr:MAG: flavodoxin-dependent (E)-4-hydroxy-3-methylbut-2-enyl-diphosphate synthase [Candidatus Dadabacteria bacterium]|tara:strand:+ start:1978 stop:3033 length:1056 start_codon:yes stop_codon:yes gene_type:complete
MRRETKTIIVGDVKIGSGNPISVQTMTKTDTRDVKSTVNQIKSVEAEGCQIVRCAVPDMDAAKALKEIVKNTNIPIVADIHFDYRLALEAIKSGIHCLRINPGNIGSKRRIEEVVKSLKVANIPVRIGVNSGSLEKDILKKYGSPTSEALVESAIRHINILDELNFHEIKISVKSSNVKIMQEAYRQLGKQTDYPLHLGVTEAGTYAVGSVKSAIGIGSLISEGLGDTIRVSLTDDPVKEVKLGNDILKALGHFKNGIELISCPGCGRLEIDLQSLVEEVEKRIADIKLTRTLKVSVLGCIVNGPGEAIGSDIGIAGGNGQGLVYKGGKLYKSCKESELVDILIEEIKNLN